MKWSNSLCLLVLLVLALCAAFSDAMAASSSPTTPQTRDLTLRPVEMASAYNLDCTTFPPYQHPTGTVFVGAFTEYPNVFGATVPVGTEMCEAYQGLVRFDLSDVDVASIVSATLSYWSEENYNFDGTTSRNRATCVGGIGATTRAWDASQRRIMSLLDGVDHFQPPRGTFISPPIDITAFLKDHMSEIRANGLVLDATVENFSTHLCYAAIGRIELRLDLAPAAP